VRAREGREEEEVVKETIRLIASFPFPFPFPFAFPFLLLFFLSFSFSKVNGFHSLDRKRSEWQLDELVAVELIIKDNG